MSMISALLTKRAEQLLEKSSFQPMPGGQPPADPNAAPPMDPSMMGGQGMPMDPSMMGGQGMPMDPSMMGGGMPGGMSMDPSMMGMGGMPAGPAPATVGQLSITDFQTMMLDMLQVTMKQIMDSMQPAAEPAPEAMAPDASEVAPQEDVRAVSNTEISEKLDALIALLSGAGAGAGAPPMPAGPEMGFGGQAMGGAPMPAAGPAMMPAPGMETQASVQAAGRNKLADMIISKTAKARRK